MTVYFYTTTPNKPGVRALVKGLNAILITRFDGLHFYLKGKPLELRDNNAIICWGDALPPILNVTVIGRGQFLENEERVILNFPTTTKFELPKLGILRNQSGIPEEITTRFIVSPDRDNTVCHRVAFDAECRAHVINGRIALFGTKVGGTGTYRSRATGWRIDYASKNPTGRGFALKVVRRLQLDMGAVDIVQLQNNWLLRKVDKSPALHQDQELHTYLRRIKRQLQHEK